ncbi:MAG: hypothetical protein AOA66_1314 [Candidatus Bathyarchaeota archaeon BA2]|nr:MAG: hypothetical protein AOA66_1314 [Candidatus Bathyarchaeota archaeon BA2]
MVMVGEEHVHEGITVKVVEVIPYRDFRNQKNLMIGYMIIDGDFTSPVAHIWMLETEDIAEKLRSVAGYYLTIKSSLKR